MQNTYCIKIITLNGDMEICPGTSLEKKGNIAKIISYFQHRIAEWL